MLSLLTNILFNKVDECNTCTIKKNLIKCKNCEWRSCTDCWLKWLNKCDKCPHCNKSELTLYLTVIRTCNLYKVHLQNIITKTNIIYFLKKFIQSYFLEEVYCYFDNKYLLKPEFLCDYSYENFLIRIFMNILKGIGIQVFFIGILIMLGGVFLQIAIVCSIISNMIR